MKQFWYNWGDAILFTTLIALMLLMIAISKI